MNPHQSLKHLGPPPISRAPSGGPKIARCRCLKSDLNIFEPWPCLKIGEPQSLHGLSYVCIMFILCSYIVFPMKMIYSFGRFSGDTSPWSNTHHMAVGLAQQEEKSDQKAWDGIGFQSLRQQ